MESVNKIEHQLTPEEVKTTNEFKNASNEEAQHIAETISIFCDIVHSYFVKNQLSEQGLMSETKVLTLNKSPIKSRAA